jgi:hypothetical protein
VTPTSETANEGIFVLGARVQSGERGDLGKCFAPNESRVLKLFWRYFLEVAGISACMKI